MSDSNDKIVGCVGILIVLAVGVVGLILWGGYVLSATWALLLVPLFGLPPITIYEAIGLSAIVGFLTVNPSSNSSSNKNKDMMDILLSLIGNFATAFLRGLIVLIIVNLVV